MLQTERTTTALLFKERENERQEKPQKSRTPMKKEGAWRPGRQTDTLQAVNSSRRRQTAGGCTHVPQHLSAEVMARPKSVQWA